jgi:hypothetical protein
VIDDLLRLEIKAVAFRNLGSVNRGNPRDIQTISRCLPAQSFPTFMRTIEIDDIDADLLCQTVCAGCLRVFDDPIGLFENYLYSHK